MPQVMDPDPWQASLGEQRPEPKNESEPARRSAHRSREALLRRGSGDTSVHAGQDLLPESRHGEDEQDDDQSQTTNPEIETALREVKKALTLQRGSYDSIERLNLVLGLMTLRANHLDRERDYAELIRMHG